MRDACGNTVIPLADHLDLPWCARVTPGARSFWLGALACAFANLVLMGPMAVLFVATGDFMAALDGSASHPSIGDYLLVIAGVLVAMVLTQWLEYASTYHCVYDESARKRMASRTHLECIRETRAANLGRFALADLDARFRAFERSQVSSELFSGSLASSAQALLKLGIGTTVLAGVSLLAAGEVGFMTFFAFVIVVTRAYDLVDIVLQSATELLFMRVSIRRTQGLMDEPIQEGSHMMPHFCSRHMVGILSALFDGAGIVTVDQVA